ncbi:hypothetical protein SDC9_172367 [bioreactor metagenome]|uniref:Uncharacterized protein n=1 Tax=bioreactor metagenome TaxID=1076179 RepID=A0A645GDG3_9ZZZZ
MESDAGNRYGCDHAGGARCFLIDRAAGLSQIPQAGDAAVQGSRLHGNNQKESAFLSIGKQFDVSVSIFQ